MAKRNSANQGDTDLGGGNEVKEKTKGAIRREAKKEALKSLLAYVKENSQDENALAYCKILTPGVRFGGAQRTGVVSIIAGAFESEGDTIHEDQVWSDYKLGRSEMRKIAVNLIKKREPEKRLWISFDADTGVYTLEGSGPDAPAGWTGYTPVDMEEMDLT